MLETGFHLKMQENRQQLVLSEQKQKFWFLGILPKDTKRIVSQNFQDFNENIALAIMIIDLMKIEIPEKIFNGITEKFMNPPISWLV